MGVIDDIKRGWTLPADGVPVDFSDHAIEASNKRHFRRIDADPRDLSRLLEGAIVTREPPSFAHRTGHRDAARASAWLVHERLGLCWPLLPGNGPRAGTLIAATCITPRRGLHVGAEVHVRGGGSQRERDGT